MTLTARIDSAIHVQARMAAHHRHIDIEWLARNADYARDVQALCREVGGMDDCVRLLDALVDAISLSDLPTSSSGVTLADHHPCFADTLADPLL